MSDGGGIGGLGGGEVGPPAGIGEQGGPSDEFTSVQKYGGYKSSYEESDLERLSPFEIPGVPQYLVEKGLITPFEFVPPELTQPYDVNPMTRHYMSPSEFALEHGGYEYDDSRLLQGGHFNPQDLKPVENWIAEMEAARENQYFDWQADFGHFLGQAGTRLASRFDTQEAQVRKQTLLPGEGT